MDLSKARKIQIVLTVTLPWPDEKPVPRQVSSYTMLGEVSNAVAKNLGVTDTTGLSVATNGYEEVA